MGTNYYLHKNVCEHCKRGDDPIHIGKSSGGWCFSLHVGEEFDEDIPKNLEEWKTAWPLGVIRDEYDHDITPEEMLDIITNRSWKVSAAERIAKVGSFSASMYDSVEEYFAKNHAEEGPNNLMRHQISPHHCIGHGEGTWDLMIGEFS